MEYSKDENRAPATNTAESSSSAAAQSNFVQSIGCTLVIDPLTFKVMAYSENCFDMLGVSSSSSAGLLGSDTRDILTPSSNIAISTAVATSTSGPPTPIWVQTSTNGRSFFAILHLLDAVLLIDLEPAHPCHLSSHAETKCQSAISRLQSIPSGRDIRVLCHALVEEVRNLTGFNRVMIYKYQDDHDEVFSKIKRPDSLKQGRVRMVCDRTSEPVRFIQSPELADQPLCLDRSTLRAPHACEVEYMTKMGSIASLVLSILINPNSETPSLWGLVVCHHTGPRHLSVLERLACEVVLNVFQVELNRILLHKQMPRKIKDLVKSDGAAVFIPGNCSQRMGVAPDESQLKDLAEWLMRTHGDSMFTESLAGSGYPGAEVLGEAGVCGMAAKRISSSGYLFLFRSKIDDSSSSSLRWEAADIDTAHRMHDITMDVLREQAEEELVDAKKELARMEASVMELKDQEEFVLGSLVDDIVSQAMIVLKEKNLRLVHDIPEEIMTMRLCGNKIKLQSALSGFLYCIADHAQPSPDGWVEVKVSHGLKLCKHGIEFVHLQFRMAHPGQGLPQDLIEEIFGSKSSGKRQRVGLNIYKKIVSKMNGNVCYVREDQNDISYFQIDIEFQTAGKSR